MNFLHSIIGGKFHPCFAITSHPFHFLHYLMSLISLILSAFILHLFSIFDLDNALTIPRTSHVLSASCWPHPFGPYPLSYPHQFGPCPLSYPCPFGPYYLSYYNLLSISLSLDLTFPIHVLSIPHRNPSLDLDRK